MKKWMRVLSLVLCILTLQWGIGPVPILQAQEKETYPAVYPPAQPQQQYTQPQAQPVQYQQPQQPRASNENVLDTFKWGNFFASCCIGPRIGLEKNEGFKIKDIEWINFVCRFIPYVGIIGVAICAAIQGGDNGIQGFLASCCIGPRVGEQYHFRRIRTMEWLLLIPFVNIVIAILIGVDAGKGKTMVEFEAKEDLRK